MLRLCHAQLIATSETQSRMLLEFARHMGFATAEFMLGKDGVPVSRSIALPVFFLIHQQVPSEQCESLVAAIRQSGNVNVRYAPVVAVASRPRVDEVMTFVQLGFDDVIALPESRKLLQTRLMAHLNSEKTYIQTGDYLGPDRRRMEQAGQVADQRRRGAAHTRITIHRPAGGAIRVMREDMVLERGSGAARMPPLPPRPLSDQHA